MNLTYEDVNWKNILIKKYVSYSLDELDCMVLFVCDAVLSIQSNVLITCDILLPYMKASKDDIDRSLSKLMNKKYIEVASSNGSIFSSLVHFKQRLFDDEIKDITLRKSVSENLNISEGLYSYLESLNGPLSPIDKDLVSSWLKQGANDGMVKEACSKAVSKSGHIIFKKADKFIAELLRSTSRQNIGVSMVNEDNRNNNEELKKIIQETVW